jgi:hypothetical protein
MESSAVTLDEVMEGSVQTEKRPSQKRRREKITRDKRTEKYRYEVKGRVCTRTMMKWGGALTGKREVVVDGLLGCTM